MNNDLAVIANQAGLAENKTQLLLKSFGDHFTQAQQIATDSKGIVVTDEKQTDIMQQAREKRLALKNIRVSVEHTRAELKEQSLRESRAIDGIANVIKALIVPVEEHLEKQEKFAELREAQRLQTRYEQRVDRLITFGVDPSLYQLRTMEDASFDKLVEGFEGARKAQIEADQKAEEERKHQELRISVYTERREKLLPYSLFVEISNLTQDTTNSEFNGMLKEAIDKKKKYEDDQEAIRKQAEKDREAREKAEAILKKEREAQAEKDRKEELERKMKADAEAKARADAEELERKTLLAPDKEKLNSLASTFEMFIFPAVRSKNAQLVVEHAEQEIKKITYFIREKAKEL